MIDQISKIIKQVGAKEASEKGISSEMMPEVTNETKDSIISGFKEAVSGGNISQITDLFQGDTSVSSLSSNPVVSGMISKLVTQLTGSLGLDSGIAKTFATAAVPKILSMLVSKSKDSGSGFNPADLISEMGGGSDAAGMLGKLGGMFGGSKDDESGDDDPLSSIKGMFN